MPPTWLRTLALALAAVAVRPADAEGLSRREDDAKPLPAPQSADECDSNRCWWLPGPPCRTRRCGDPLSCLAGLDAAAGSLSLIEEAAQRLRTPRFDGPLADLTSPPDGAAPLPADALKPSGDQFSRPWSDGAPLLLYDWSGKSGDARSAPGLRPDGLQRVASASTATDFADLSSKVKLRERDALLDPTGRNSWETDETVKVPVAGSVFLFNQVSASTPAVEERQYKWLGKTGVGVKLKPWLFQEVQLRTGPAVRYDDTSTLSKGQSPERSELFLEAVTKVPVPVVGPVNVEYTGYAVPAATPADHNQVNQDVKLALPFSGTGQFHVGAKYKWEAAAATPWMDRMQLYMGVQSKW